MRATSKTPTSMCGKSCGIRKCCQTIEMWRFYVARLATRRTVCEPALVSGEETGPSDKREDLPGGGPTTTAFAFLGGLRLWDQSWHLRLSLSEISTLIGR